MNKKDFLENWKIFFNSFKLSSDFLYILFYDLLFYGIIRPLIYLFSYLMSRKMSAIDPDILSKLNSLANVTASQSLQIQQAAQAMNSFFYTLIIGVILMILITLFAFTLTRALIWNHLLKKKFDIKKYLRFNLLNLVLAVILAVILYILLKIRIGITGLFVKISFNFAVVLSGILYLLIFIAIIYFVSLVYINYTKKAEVFGSLTRVFRLIKTRFQKISISYLFILLASAVITLIAMLRWLLPVYLQSYLNYALVLIFLAWMRIYIVKIIK